VVDKLKRSLEELEPPICPSCHIEMKWIRSSLTSSETILHLFHCANCHRTGETISNVNPTVVRPDKLSSPSHRHAA